MAREIRMSAFSPSFAGAERLDNRNALRDLKAKRPDLAEQIDALLVVPEGITSSMTDFTTDPRPIYEHRRKVARLLEQ